MAPALIRQLCNAAQRSLIHITINLMLDKCSKVYIHHSIFIGQLNSANKGNSSLKLLRRSHKGGQNNKMITRLSQQKCDSFATFVLGIYRAE